MDKILEAILFEAKRHRALAKLGPMSADHTHQAELLEQAAEIIKDGQTVTAEGR